MITIDTASTLASLSAGGRPYQIYSLVRLAEETGINLSRLPYTLRVMLEMALRRSDSASLSALLEWQPDRAPQGTVSFYPGRVLLQDLSGVPVLNDLAALRAALVRSGVDPHLANPILPVDLVIDHSVQLDSTGSPTAFQTNHALEFSRNAERFAFLRWCQQAFPGLRIIPPGAGIVHQVNLEYLAPLVLSSPLSQSPGTQASAPLLRTPVEGKGVGVLYPDSLVGTDSHTTMINALGVAGFGVGGIEAIAALLGRPVEIPVPRVIGVRLEGRLPSGATATDLVLTLTQRLRQYGVVDCFVEFTGPALYTLPIFDRAPLANMAPEYGATLAYFPVDEQTLEYLRLTGRPFDLVQRIETYYRAQGLFRDRGDPEPRFNDLLAIDLTQIEPSIAGPKRPQDRLSLSQVKGGFKIALTRPKAEQGYALPSAKINAVVDTVIDDKSLTLRHGAIALASIASCTNTANPGLLVAAGLVAKKALALGLRVAPQVQTSFTPGSPAVADFLHRAGLLTPLEQLGFHIVAHGCAACIGNTGPLPAAVTQAIQDGELVAAAVLSGNRNFEGRIHPLLQANYLASPPLVVAYALAGTVDLDLTSEPIGCTPDGAAVALSDIWPSPEEIQAIVAVHLDRQTYTDAYAHLLDSNPAWNALPAPSGWLYEWSSSSTYLLEPPFLSSLPLAEGNQQPGSFPLPLVGRGEGFFLRTLAFLPDSVTTDHISPAGAILPGSPAAQWLLSRGVSTPNFNTYGARRGNHEVLTRATLSNPRLRNRLAQGKDGGYTTHLPSGELLTIFDAARRYQSEGTPLLIIAGKEYGTGSSRDWAAKGVQQLGVKAVLAESFERIHRSNLAGMGVLPLQFLAGESAVSLGLTGRETYTFANLAESLASSAPLTITATGENGAFITFQVQLRLDTPTERHDYSLGGLLPALLSELVNPIGYRQAVGNA